MSTSTKPVLVRRPSARTAPEISDALVAELREHLAARRISTGIALFEQHTKLLERLNPTQPNAARIAGLLAVWADIGFAEPELVKRTLARFPREVRSRLPLGDYVHLRLAEGMLAMSEELEDEAIRHLDFAATIAEDVQDGETLAIAHFWKGRCLRKKGEYEASMQATLRGRDLALERGHREMAAAVQVLHSWLLFQKGKLSDALSTLEQAHDVLKHTDDHVTLGNIHSAYGRIARRNGQHQRAIEHFASAITEYRKRDPRHRNLARTLANIALVERAVARQLSYKIDITARRSRGTQGKSGAARPVAQIREQMEQLRREAFAHLDEAAEIYAFHPNHHGGATVHINRGYLHLDTGDFDLAETEAGAAYGLAQEKRDSIAMARARLLQCMTDNARVEEEVGEDAAKHAHRALDCARDAVELAQRTENRKLLASAYVWHGLSHCNGFFEDCESARESYDEAVAVLKGLPGEWPEELHALKSKIVRGASVDATLRAWSEGAIGSRTFQQVSEEFAELVIPKVWEREGKKVSRVAARLSISPKKVRRILTRAGKRKSER
jgi:tetratricopeptide (TPR) repeat protein